MIQGSWFVYLTVAVLLLVVLFMPKRNLKWWGIYLTFGVVGQLAWLLDSFFASPLDIFDLAKKNTTELSDVFTIGVVPPLFAIVFLNFYKKDRKWGLVLLFTALSFLFEWGLVKVDYMTLKGWKTWYSLPVYFAMYAWFLPWHDRVMKWGRE